MSYGKIDRYLLNNGLKKIKHYKLTVETVNGIIEQIKKGVTREEITKNFSVDKNTITAIAKENNLTIKKYGSSRSEKNKDFNDNYFHVIDTENKAYFLGLIYTDGNVRKHNGGYYLNLELKRSDRYILEKLASELKCSNQIYDRERITNFGPSKMSSFTICNSKQIFDDLARFNIVPNKSHTTESFSNIIELIPKDLIKHFLRGLIDGDGTISKRFTTYNNCICVNQNERKFCEDFDKLLKYSMNDYSLKENYTYNKNNSVHGVRYRRINDVKKILEFLYKNASIFLKRKYILSE